MKDKVEQNNHALLLALTASILGCAGCATAGESEPVTIEYERGTVTSHETVSGLEATVLDEAAEDAATLVWSRDDEIVEVAVLGSDRASRFTVHDLTVENANSLAYAIWDAVRRTDGTVRVTNAEDLSYVDIEQEESSSLATDGEAPMSNVIVSSGGRSATLTAILSYYTDGNKYMRAGIGLDVYGTPKPSASGITYFIKFISAGNASTLGSASCTANGSSPSCTQYTGWQSYSASYIQHYVSSASATVYWGNGTSSPVSTSVQKLY